MFQNGNFSFFWCGCVSSARQLHCISTTTTVGLERRLGDGNVKRPSANVPTLIQKEREFEIPPHKANPKPQSQNHKANPKPLTLNPKLQP